MLNLHDLLKNPLSTELGASIILVLEKFTYSYRTFGDVSVSSIRTERTTAMQSSWWLAVLDFTFNRATISAVLVTSLFWRQCPVMPHCNLTWLLPLQLWNSGLFRDFHQGRVFPGEVERADYTGARNPFRGRGLWAVPELAIITVAGRQGPFRAHGISILREEKKNFFTKSI